MDINQIRQLEPKLVEFLDQFSDCFDRKDTRAHLGVYVRGQLSDLPQKSVEPIALEADVAPRTLQEFLSQLKWRENQRARSDWTSTRGRRSLGLKRHLIVSAVS